MRMLPVLGALATVAAILVPGLAWCDHTGGPPGSMSPWLEALLWGAAGLAVAMTVALIAIAFTRAPADEKGERGQQ